MAAKSRTSKQSSNGTSTLDLAQLEDRFARITRLMYDTSVPVPTLEREVTPLLGADVEFVDPWVRVRGRERFAAGLCGFHSVVRFDIDLFQIAVDVDKASGRGRAMVDGMMCLRQLGFYTYPLRTMIVYDFAIDGDAIVIDRVEEMWSLGDMIQNVPGVGRLYELYRRAWGGFFVRVFRIACAAAAKRRLGAAKADPSAS